MRGNMAGWIGHATSSLFSVPHLYSQIARLSTRKSADIYELKEEGANPSKIAADISMKKAATENTVGERAIGMDTKYRVPAHDTSENRRTNRRSPIVFAALFPITSTGRADAITAKDAPPTSMRYIYKRRAGLPDRKVSRAIAMNSNTLPFPVDVKAASERVGGPPCFCSFATPSLKSLPASSEVARGCKTETRLANASKK
mmetsp:Transcript_49973/g.128609  ORF Transcript_49973/g.128609 Transcript_49973/m.128609 type:complete len:201 (-) Transcript_49973:321-923(-)